MRKARRTEWRGVVYRSKSEALMAVYLDAMGGSFWEKQSQKLFYYVTNTGVWSESDFAWERLCFDPADVVDTDDILKTRFDLKHQY